jgi:hypothetical protein
MGRGNAPFVRTSTGQSRRRSVVIGKVPYHDSGEHLRFQNPPLEVLVFRHRDVLGCEEHPGDAVDGENPFRERRLHAFPGAGEINGRPIRKHGLSGKKHQRRGVGGGLGLDEDGPALGSECSESSSSLHPRKSQRRRVAGDRETLWHRLRERHRHDAPRRKTATARRRLLMGALCQI